MAPTGVDTSVLLGGLGDTDTPPSGFPNFFGTSASAPHVAAAAALVDEAVQKYLTDPSTGAFLPGCDPADYTAINLLLNNTVAMANTYPGMTSRMVMGIFR